MEIPSFEDQTSSEPTFASQQMDEQEQLAPSSGEAPVVGVLPDSTNKNTNKTRNSDFAEGDVRHPDQLDKAKEEKDPSKDTASSNAEDGRDTASKKTFQPRLVSEWWDNE